jgi:hypothetical protein
LNRILLENTNKNGDIWETIKVQNTYELN